MPPSQPEDPRFLALIGPTASGKTRLSLPVAEALDGEIISMDSRQVYRGLDVGTAKASLRERGRVPHHGLDLLDPDEHYSAGGFARDARRWIREIEGRGRVPILVGGTGFFLQALMEPMFREPPLDEVRVERLRETLAECPRRRLESWVRALDPDRAEVALEGGPQRMIRTLEVALLTGRPLSWWHEEGELEGRAISGLIVVLTLSRERLDHRIRRRARTMVEEGFVEEVRRLRAAGYGRDAPAMTGTGYREMRAHLRDEISLDDALRRTVTATRQYSRRQLSWFRNQLPPGAVTLDGSRSLAEQVQRVVQLWTRARDRLGEETVKRDETNGETVMGDEMDGRGGSAWEGVDP